jgi:hypothetical protein
VPSGSLPSQAMLASTGPYNAIAPSVLSAVRRSIAARGN